MENRVVIRVTTLWEIEMTDILDPIFDLLNRKLDQVKIPADRCEKEGLFLTIEEKQLINRLMKDVRIESERMNYIHLPTLTIDLVTELPIINQQDPLFRLIKRYNELVAQFQSI